MIKIHNVTRHPNWMWRGRPQLILRGRKLVPNPDYYPELDNNNNINRRTEQVVIEVEIEDDCKDDDVEVEPE